MRWYINIKKNGKAVIVYDEARGIKPTQMIMPDNKDMILTDRYLEVAYKGQKLRLPFCCVWYDKMPLPYGVLISKGYLTNQPMNLLNMLYEFISLILYNNNPMMINKIPINPNDLFYRYISISNKFDWVDFAVIGNSIPLPY